MLALYTLVRRQQRQGEDLFDTARRMLIEEAMEECRGNQKAAAELLGITPRAINYHLANFGERPKDYGDSPTNTTHRWRKYAYEEYEYEDDDE